MVEDTSQSLVSQSSYVKCCPTLILFLQGVADHALSRPPSAISTFSNLISSLNSRHASMEPSSRTALTIRTTSKPELYFVGPNSLPTEILMSIFQFVFEACIDWNKAGTLCPRHTTAWLEDDPLSPSLFPYSLASVCVRWLHVLSSVAVYWTRQVITVDSHATSPIAFQSVLRWVGNLSLQLIVTRHPSNYGETHRDEHARIRAVLEIFRPHIHHTWSLTFNVKYSSSLPALWREQGDAQYLSVLTLMSSHSETGTVADLPRLPELHPARNGGGCNTSLRPRFLEEVTLGGQFFNDALMLGEQRNLWFCNITSLTIRGCSTSSGSGISLHKFIITVQNCGLLQKLTVEEISFVNDVQSSDRFRLEVPVVSLRRITGGDAFGCIVSQALGVHWKEAITVSNSPFDGFGKRSSFRGRISSTNLILDGMNASTAAIRQLVCFWNGESLSLINCPGVSASFLRGAPTKETPPGLRRLRVVDCENVSAEALVTLVRSRELQSAVDALVPGDPDDEPCVALVELRVHGRGPPISPEQAAWFAQHVENFSWDTIAGDGMQYVWDTAARELIVHTT